MSGRRRSRGLVVLIVVVFTLLLAEGLLVTFVLVSPDASAGLEGAVAAVDRTWSGSEGKPGVRTRVASAFHRGYQDWLVPLWHEPVPPTGNAEFTGCVDCHPDYATDRKFSVYMNHPLHAQIGVQCETCHPENAHPNPPRPQEATCAGCHEEVSQKNKCGVCHPPASLPHFYLLGAPRDSVVQCDVCHPKNSFPTRGTDPLVPHTDFYGGDRATCLSCHQDTSCSSCHEPPHPSDWIQIHGPAVDEDPTTCFTCHSSDQWCSDRCHAVTWASVPGPYPLPSAGVRP